MPKEIYPASWASELFRQSRKNAATRGIPFDLTRDEFCSIVVRAGGCCELTRIPFETQLSAAAMQTTRRPYFPSLDRIRSDEGYNAENCRLVCSAVNAALNVWGESVLRRIAIGFLGFADPPAIPPSVRARKGRHGFRYHVRVRRDGREKSLGSYATLEEAKAVIPSQGSPKNLGSILSN